MAAAPRLPPGSRAFGNRMKGLLAFVASVPSRAALPAGVPTRSGSRGVGGFTRHPCPEGQLQLVLLPPDRYPGSPWQPAAMGGNPPLDEISPEAEGACSHRVATAHPPNLRYWRSPPQPPGRVSSRGRMIGLLANHGLRGHPPARARTASYPVLVHPLAGLLHTAFRPRLATTPLCFANPSPPSGWVADFHLQAVQHARHTERIEGLLALDGRADARPESRSGDIVISGMPE